VILKFFNFIDIIIEFVLFGIDIYLMHNLKQQGLGKVGVYNEAERRKKFAMKFRNSTLFWLILTAVGFIAVQFTLETKYCTSDQALEWFSICTDCQVAGCTSCQKSGPYGCDECVKGQFFDRETAMCSDCDKFEDHTICEKCSSFDNCLKCSAGYKLGVAGDEAGKCIPCDGKNCANCDDKTSLCLGCLNTFYLDAVDNSCKAC